MLFSVEDPLALLPYLRLKFPDHSAKSLKRMIELGACSVNGRPERFASRCLKAGDQVAFQIQDKAPAKQGVILFEDEWLLAIDKPPFLPSDPEGAKKMLGKLASCHLAHRLDLETTGVLLFAKTLDSLQALESLFRERLIEKKYLAFVAGRPSKKKGTIDNFLAKETKHSSALVRSTSKEKGLRAITHWQVLEEYSSASLLACSPLTGRTHQIRVHLSEMGHPILGERKYASPSHISSCPGIPKRCLLHASKLSFIHPFTKKTLSIHAPTPLDFNAIQEALSS
ncbi:MAG: rluC [Chlamydiales bacterium]|jgi:23S rRNA pseudouridine955/2504/2580 synthase/23S rRNA pseudouridine1911/1915/1917 synthase|nr:rluC [Chlamydiales bacterium]